jgi:hypothetical protein
VGRQRPVRASTTMLRAGAVMGYRLLEIHR